MANTLTNLIPDAYAALNVVSRELTGLIAATNRLTGLERLAVGQSLRSSAAPVNTAGKDTTAAMALPAAADQTIGSVPFTLSKSRAFPFSWSGEETVGINSGPGYLTVQQQQIAQAFRAAVAEMSVDGYAAARVSASRAFGTAGTTAFGTNLGESAQVKKILDDNGAPMSDRSLVIDTTAGASLRTLLNNPLTANASLASDNTRAGVLIDVNGFAIREEARIGSVTKGTGTSYTSSAAGFAVGTTSIPVITGSGTILAGDVVTFAGDTNKYVVATGVTAPGTIVLAQPGLLKAIPASATALTIGNNFVANLAFSRDAIVLGTRLPALPATGDMAIMRETIVDEQTGLAFELAAYGGYRMVTFEVSIAWGWAVEKPQHLAILLG
jgi:hypothetical protein